MTKLVRFCILTFFPTAAPQFPRVVRDKYQNPLSLQLDERYALYFDWKQATISHTIPNFPKVMAIGTQA
jgi:hypothetical protein